MAGGNYGGSSTPTVAIPGDVLLTGINTAYSGWVCTSMIDASVGSFTYSGQSVNTSTSPIEFVMFAPLLGGMDSTQTFFCYDCNCAGQMNYFVLSEMNNYRGSTGQVNSVFQPTIIGGGGLMS